MKEKELKKNPELETEDIFTEGADVSAPVNMIMEHENLSGRRTALQKETFEHRKAYLKELKEDLDEVSKEILKEDSLRKALSLLNTKYAIERTILAEERNIMAEERSILGEKRTRASIQRTELSENRSGLARIRTLLAKNRFFLAEKITMMAKQRTFLAKARTELAFIRTGVAFIALATGLMRYFGIGWWTIMDGTIFALGLTMVGIGIYYYIPSRRQEEKIIDLIKQSEEEIMERRPRIMVLDDDASVCKLLKLHFTKAGYDVDPFIDPLAAKERLEIVDFDVVITDLMMEGMDGFQILHLIKRISPTTRVIMISHMAPDQKVLEGMHQDLFDYFKKPVDIKKLQASVKKALEEKVFKLDGEGK